MIHWLTSGYVRFGVRKIGNEWQVVYTQGKLFGVQGGYYSTRKQAEGAAYAYAQP